MSKLTGSKKATQFTESVIREMTRLNHLYGGVNLSQGFPDFPAPDAIKARDLVSTWHDRLEQEGLRRS